MVCLIFWYFKPFIWNILAWFWTKQKHKKTTTTKPTQYVYIFISCSLVKVFYCIRTSIEVGIVYCRLTCTTCTHMYTATHVHTFSQIFEEQTVFGVHHTTSVVSANKKFQFNKSFNVNCLAMLTLCKTIKESNERTNNNKTSVKLSCYNNMQHFDNKAHFMFLPKKNTTRGRRRLKQKSFQ